MVEVKCVRVWACAQMQCVGLLPNVFSRCFSPWYIYHGIGLMRIKPVTWFGNDLSLYAKVSE